MPMIKRLYAFSKARAMLNKFLLVISVRLKRVLAGRMLGNPASIALETVSNCNLNCPGCPVPTQAFSETRVKKFMSLDELLFIHDFVGNYCDTYILSLWGESLIHKEFPKVLNIFSDKFVIISTNLSVPKRQVQALIEWVKKGGQLKELIVSMDGWDKMSYETYYRHGGKFDLVSSNLNLLAESQVKTKVSLQFLDDGSILDFKEKSQEFAAQLGLRFSYTKMDRNFDRNKRDLWPDNKCHHPYESLKMNSSLDLLVCCADPFGALRYANLKEFRSFRELWNCKQLREKRIKLATSKNQFDLCTGCEGYQHPLL